MADSARYARARSEEMGRKLYVGNLPYETGETELQELFGLADTPRIGPRKEPVRIALLAPNGRPVQTTRDLRSFWNTTYAEVRKELRGRYPKHPWPEDPWTAMPTARTTRRRRSWPLGLELPKQRCAGARRVVAECGQRGDEHHQPNRRRRVQFVQVRRQAAG